MDALIDEPDIIRSFDSTIESVQEGERAIVSRINTDTVDRLRTLIDPMGCDVSHFNKTRSVFWEHGKSVERGTIPIGSGWAKVRKSERDMIGKTTFARDDFSQALFDLCKDGHLRSWSIKARKCRGSAPTAAERRLRPELTECDAIYRSWELEEYSLVSVPGNSDALTMMVSRGLIQAPEGFVVPAPAAVEPGPVAGLHVLEMGGSWHVMDGTKRMITAPTSALAEECLLAIQVKPSPSLETRLSGSLSQIRSMGSEINRDVQEYIDLYRWGRI